MVHFATESTHFAIQVRTFQSQPSAAPWRGSSEAILLGHSLAPRAYAALCGVPSLFKSFEKSLEKAHFRLRLTSDMALVKALDTFNPTRELP